MMSEQKNIAFVVWSILVLPLLATALAFGIFMIGA
jgi:hypothetical protein